MCATLTLTSRSVARRNQWRNERYVENNSERTKEGQHTGETRE